MFIQVKNLSKVFNKNLAVDKINFQIEKNKNKTDFKTSLNLKNLDLKFNDISYSKTKNDNANLNVQGFVNEKKLFLNTLERFIT